MKRPTEAMERLRRVKNGMSASEAREMCASDKGWRGPDEDRHTLADYLLSRIPRERPEANNFTGLSTVWIIDGGVVTETVWRMTPRGAEVEVYGSSHNTWEMVSEYPAYPTEYDATLALIYQRWDEIDDLVERLEKLTKESEVVG